MAMIIWNHEIDFWLDEYHFHITDHGVYVSAGVVLYADVNKERFASDYETAQKVRAAWVAYCIEMGDTAPSHLAPWEELSEQDKEVDMRIGEAVALAYEKYSEELLKEQERVIHLPIETRTLTVITGGIAREITRPELPGIEE